MLSGDRAPDPGGPTSHKPASGQDSTSLPVPRCSLVQTLSEPAIPACANHTCNSLQEAGRLRSVLGATTTNSRTSQGTSGQGLVPEQFESNGFFRTFPLGVSLGTVRTLSSHHGLPRQSSLIFKMAPAVGFYFPHCVLV